MGIVVLVSFPAPYEILPFSACFLRPENALKVPFFVLRNAVFNAMRSVLHGRKKPSKIF